MEINKAVFSEFPLLKTPRLTLRKIEIPDAEEIFKMRANGHVNRFIPRPTMTKQEDAVSLVEKTNMAYENQQGIGWAGVLRENKAIVGTCGFNMIDFYNLRAEIGGELAVNFWGKHIAIEAVSAIIDFGFKTMNLHTIEAKMSPNNRGAIFLIEQLGFEKEAHYKDRVYHKGKFDDMAVYSLIRGNENLY